VRAFVAAGLPDDVRQAVADTLAPVQRRSSGVRWVAPESLHITLQFLGAVPADRVEPVCAALEAAVAPAAPFPMTLRAFGAFPDARRPRVLWLGIEDAPALLDVQRAVAAALQTLGFTPEARPFHPHVTVGRAERGARAADAAAAAAAAAERTFEAQVTVHSIELMESRLLRDGARYSVARRFHL
jgi:2'-5' RNA ligase